MWIELYLVAAAIAATAAWLLSPRFQSYDPPSDVARGFWSVTAGVLWPLIAVGAAQLLAIRYIARRVPSTGVQGLEEAALVPVPVASRS